MNNSPGTVRIPLDVARDLLAQIEEGSDIPKRFKPEKIIAAQATLISWGKGDPPRLLLNLTFGRKNKRSSTYGFTITQGKNGRSDHLTFVWKNKVRSAHLPHGARDVRRHMR